MFSSSASRSSSLSSSSSTKENPENKRKLCYFRNGLAYWKGTLIGIGMLLEKNAAASKDGRA